MARMGKQVWYGLFTRTLCNQAILKILCCDEPRLCLRGPSFPYASMEDDTSIIKGTYIIKPIDTEEAPKILIFQSNQDVVEVKNEPSIQLTTA